MAIKRYKPVTPGQRFKTTIKHEELSKKGPEKKLTKHKKNKAGRNNSGRITVRRRGGGHKRKIRIVDFKRELDNRTAKVISLEYDPNRSANIALLQYSDGKKSYIIAPEGLNVGDEVVAGEKDISLKPGNVLPLKEIPVGVNIHCIEIRPNNGAKMVRSAGTFATILAKEGKYAHIKLPSGEVRLFNLKCKATLGEIGNKEHDNIKLGKAGRSRWLVNLPHLLTGSLPIEVCASPPP
jgi:large subunit ribosomal protein L2